LNLPIKVVPPGAQRLDLGYLHVDVKDLPQMARESCRRYLFAAIDRVMRWVFVRIYPAKPAANAAAFYAIRNAPMNVG